MASGVNVICPDCKLKFPSMKLFLKHREKFCDKGDLNEIRSQRSHMKRMLDELADRRSQRYSPRNQEHQATVCYSPITNNELDQRSFSSTSSLSIPLPPDTDESGDEDNPQHTHVTKTERKHQEKLRQLKAERRKLAKEKAEIQKKLEQQQFQPLTSVLRTELPKMRSSQVKMSPVPMFPSQRADGRLPEVREQIARDLLNQERFHLHQQQQQQQQQLQQQQQQQQHQQQLAAMQYQLEMMKQQAELDRMMNRMKLEVNDIRQTTVARQQPAQPDYTDVIEDMPVLLQTRISPSPSRSLNTPSATVYDPSAGFVLFCDFILGLDMSMQMLRLVTAMYKVKTVIREPVVLPKVSCDSLTSTFHGDLGKSIVIGALQSHAECPADRELCILVELQIASVVSTSHQKAVRLTTQAWCKIPLFDDQLTLNTGRWRVKLRTLPIHHDISFSQISNIPQFGSMELFLRLAHSSKNKALSQVPLLPMDMPRYSYFSQLQLPAEVPLPPPSVTPPQSHTSEHEEEQEEEVLGFQVDHVKNTEQGRAKVKLAAYHLSSEQLARNADGPVMSVTKEVISSFKYKYHVFGREQVTFKGVEMSDDMLIIARLHIRPIGDHRVDIDGVHIGKDGRLMAWAALPLTKGDKRVNTGTHVMPLFQPPVPKISAILFNQKKFPKSWLRYRRATLKVYVFRGLPRPGSLTPSDQSEDDGEDKVCPLGAWLPFERSSPPVEPFHDGDGFDLYIDGCLNLPDAVTISRVSAVIKDRGHHSVSREIGTSVFLDSDIHNPVYELRAEFRKPNLPPTSTLLFTLMTWSSFENRIVIAGYATLNIFVETGTTKQPVTDAWGTQISLNDGAHQLRLYQLKPNENGRQLFTGDCLQKIANRVIPCATILVRLLKTPLGPNGLPLETSSVPRVQWERLGIWQPRPRYRDRIYYSLECRPTLSEAQLFHAFLKRGRVATRSIIPQITTPSQLTKLVKDRAIENFIRNQLTTVMDVKTEDMDLTYVTQYSPTHGIKCAIDCALGVPWASFSYVLMSLNPPAAFYEENAASYDRPTFTEELELQSTSSKPIWRDGYKHFPDRTYHKYLTVILHLQEVVVTQNESGNKYKLAQQAWTALNVFREGYVCTDTYQLPLFHGSPPDTVIQDLTQRSCTQCLNANVRNHTLCYMDRASLIVRLCDSRREDELLSYTSSKPKLSPNVQYVPEALVESFTQQSTDANLPDRLLDDLVPPAYDKQQFMNNLPAQFKNLVYKVNEQETGQP